MAMSPSVRLHHLPPSCRRPASPTNLQSHAAMCRWPTPISTKGYETLLRLVDNTCSDSFDLYNGLFMYNKNATELLNRLEWAMDAVKKKLFDGLHDVLRKQLFDFETGSPEETSVDAVPTEQVVDGGPIDDDDLDDDDGDAVDGDESRE